MTHIPRICHPSTIRQKCQHERALHRSESISKPTAARMGHQHDAVRNGRSLELLNIRDEISAFVGWLMEERSNEWWQRRRCSCCCCRP
jgi:hypothetical protein